MRFKFVLMCALLCAAASAEAAPECIKLVGPGNSNYLQNTCNQRIGMISFCWESQKAACSCYRGTGCSAGPISPGQREPISGPERPGQTNIKFSWCVYDDWVKGTCKPTKYR